MDPQYIQNTVAYNLDTVPPKKWGSFQFQIIQERVMERNNNFSLFNHSRIFGIFGDLLPEQESHKRRWSKTSIPCIPNTAWCFCPQYFFFSKSQVRLLPLIIGQVELRIPSCFCRPPSITCVRDQGDAHRNTLQVPTNFLD